MSPNKKADVPKFLAGWKEIANYLDKGVRTVQRYEREMGLPVRRPAGKSRAAVVATKAELDAWVDASPLRHTLSLTRPAIEQATFAAEIGRRVEEMRRLSAQMRKLRSELKESVSDLRETVRMVERESNPVTRRSRVFSLADFDRNNKTVFDLVGMKTDGKAH